MLDKYARKGLSAFEIVRRFPQFFLLQFFCGKKYCFGSRFINWWISRPTEPHTEHRGGITTTERIPKGQNILNLSAMDKGQHSWKKCFFLGGIILILRRNFFYMDEDFSNIEETFS